MKKEMVPGSSGNSGTVEKIVFDLSSDPWLPCDSWKIKRHTKSGLWDFARKELVIFQAQKCGGKYPTFRELLERFEGRQVNSNFIEGLFTNPKLISDIIPEIERGVRFVCLGTLFDDSKGRDYARAIILPGVVSNLDFDNPEELPEPKDQRGKPHWLCVSLDEECGPNCRVILFKEGFTVKKKDRFVFLKKIAALF